MTYLAIDYGKVKTGLAVAINDIAIPLKITDTKTLFPTLASLMKERRISTVIVWMAYHMDGTVSSQMHRTYSFLSQFKKHFPHITVVEWDERLSTFEAKDSLVRKGVKKADAVLVDDISASIILENFLKAKQNV